MPQNRYKQPHKIASNNFQDDINFICSLYTTGYTQRENPY